MIIDFWEKTVSESPTREGTGRAVRGAHAKTLGFVRVEVEMLGGGALIRFSMASNHLWPGRAPRSRSRLRDQLLRHQRNEAGRRRARLDHLRPGAEEQLDLHRQHREHDLFIQEIGNDSAKYLGVMVAAGSPH